MTMRTLKYYCDLILVLTGKDFKVRYKCTVLGYAWSLMHPLAFAMVFFALFKIVMRFNIEAYVLFLIAALFPWQWLVNSVTTSGHFFLANAPLIKKVRFHRATLVYSGVLTESLHFVASIPIVLLLMLYYNRLPNWQWLCYLPLLVAGQFMLTTGLSLLIATGNLFFRDLERITQIVMQLLFYMTPVLYPIDRVPDAYQWVLYLNPFTPFVLGYRGLFYYETATFECVYCAAVWGALCLALGFAVYHALARRFAELV